MATITLTIRETVENNKRIWYVVNDGQDWSRHERSTDAWNEAERASAKMAEVSQGTAERSTEQANTWIIRLPILKSPFHNNPIG